jgi:hypothetical protein
VSAGRHPERERPVPPSFTPGCIAEGIVPKRVETLRESLPIN